MRAGKERHTKSALLTHTTNAARKQGAMAGRRTNNSESVPSHQHHQPNPWDMVHGRRPDGTESSQPARRKKGRHRSAHIHQQHRQHGKATDMRSANVPTETHIHTSTRGTLAGHHVSEPGPELSAATRERHRGNWGGLKHTHTRTQRGGHKTPEFETTASSEKPRIARAEKTD